MASIDENYLEINRVFTQGQASIPTGLVWNINMATVSLFWNTNVADMTSFENSLWENGNLVPRVLSYPRSPRPQVFSCHIGKRDPGSEVVEKVLHQFSINFHLVVLPAPNFQTVHALCVRAIPSVRKSG